jgi:hypothetical protein
MERSQKGGWLLTETRMHGNRDMRAQNWRLRRKLESPPPTGVRRSKAFRRDFSGDPAGLRGKAADRALYFTIAMRFDDQELRPVATVLPSTSQTKRACRGGW